MTSQDHLGSVEGKRILVTGATGGIGRVLCAELAAAGAELSLVSRNEDALKKLAADLKGNGHRFSALDVADEPAWIESLPTLVGDRLNGVVTAAARVTPIGPAGVWSVKDFSRTMDINVTGTLLPIILTLPKLKEFAGSVVTFSGGGSTSPLARFDAYAASKAAVVRLTENLSRELAADGVRLNSVAPGFVVTSIHDSTIAAGPAIVGKDYFEKTRKEVESGGGDSPIHAAKLTRFLLSDLSAGITGRLISARWDPWENEEFQEKLHHDDSLGTLRRIDDQFFTAGGIRRE